LDRVRARSPQDDFVDEATQQRFFLHLRQQALLPELGEFLSDVLQCLA
jgi:hypothetical protein